MAYAGQAEEACAKGQANVGSNCCSCQVQQLHTMVTIAKCSFSGSTVSAQRSAVCHWAEGKSQAGCHMSMQACCVGVRDGPPNAVNRGTVLLVCAGTCQSFQHACLCCRHPHGPWRFQRRPLQLQWERQPLHPKSRSWAGVWAGRPRDPGCVPCLNPLSCGRHSQG